MYRVIGGEKRAVWGLLSTCWLAAKFIKGKPLNFLQSLNLIYLFIAVFAELLFSLNITKEVTTPSLSSFRETVCFRMTIASISGLLLTYLCFSLIALAWEFF